jgi:hypothetical protein
MNDTKLESIIELFDEIGTLYEGCDWLLIKKYLLRYLRPEDRKSFSTRDPKTKKHIINSFEEDLIELYYNKFNVKLVLDEEKRL